MPDTLTHVALIDQIQAREEAHLEMEMGIEEAEPKNRAFEKEQKKMGRKAKKQEKHLEDIADTECPIA